MTYDVRMSAEVYELHESRRLIALADAEDPVAIATQWQRDAYDAHEYSHDELDSLALALRLIVPVAAAFWRGVDEGTDTGCNAGGDDFEWVRGRVVQSLRRNVGIEDEDDE